MARRYLDLKITELATKVRWLETLDTLLRDARVLADAEWDLRRMRYTLDLERIDYGNRTVWQGGESISEYPTVPCRLVISPVISCIDGRDVSEIFGPGEVLEALQLRDRKELALVSTYGTTRLRLGSDPSLEIRDVGPPNHERVICDYGDPGFDLEQAGELLRSRRL